jgi:hypothetical protein
VNERKIERKRKKEGKNKERKEREKEGSKDERKKERKKENGNCEFEKASEALFLWFTQQRERCISIWTSCSRKGGHFSQGFNAGEYDVTASTGWVDD